MSLQTALNRWRRYQVARLEGLVEGLAREARRIPTSSREHDVRVLGAAMLVALDEHCQSVAEDLGADFATGQLRDIPDFRFERL
jgi:hypothetical protein